MSEFQDSEGQGFSSSGLASSEQYEPEYLPKKFRIGETEDEITVDRRLTKTFPITDQSEHISYVHIPSNGENPHDKGKFIFGGATWEIGHEELDELAREIGVLPEDAPEPDGGGILTKVGDRYKFDRDSDLYGNVDDKEVRRAFISAINKEYSDLY